MTRKGKICLIAVSLVLSLPVIAVVDHSLDNWRLKHAIRAAFNLTSKPIATNTIQTAAQKLFPPGAQEADVRQYLTRYFGPNFFVAWTPADGQSLSCAFDSEFGWWYRYNFELRFFLDISNKVSKVEVYDRS